MNRTILVVGQMNEAHHYRSQFVQRDIFTVNTPYSLYGMPLARAYYTPLAANHRNWGQVSDILRCALMKGVGDGSWARVVPVSKWKTEAEWLTLAIAALPAGRDLGYNLAIADVLTLLSRDGLVA